MCAQEERAAEETAEATPAAAATVPEEEAAEEKAAAADSEVTTATETGAAPAASPAVARARVQRALALCTCMCVSEHNERKSARHVWESSSAARGRTCVCRHSNARLPLSMLRLDAAPLHPGSRAQRAGIRPALLCQESLPAGHL